MESQPPLSSEMMNLIDPDANAQDVESTGSVGDGDNGSGSQGASGDVGTHRAGAEDGADKEPGPEGTKQHVAGASGTPPLGASSVQLTGPGTDLIKQVELCKQVLDLLVRCARVFTELHGTSSGLSTEWVL